MIHLSPTPPPLTTLYGPFQPASNMVFPLVPFLNLFLIAFRSLFFPYPLPLLLRKYYFLHHLCFGLPSLPYSGFLSSFSPLFPAFYSSPLPPIFRFSPSKKGRRNGKEKALLWIRILEPQKQTDPTDPDPGAPKTDCSYGSGFD
jgi:hypothetical protein